MNSKSRIPIQIQSKIQYDAKEGNNDELSRLEGRALWRAEGLSRSWNEKTEFFNSIVFSTGNVRTNKNARACAESGFSESGFETIDGLGQVLAYCQANIQ
jgi:hypothetical protein